MDSFTFVVNGNAVKIVTDTIETELLRWLRVRFDEKYLTDELGLTNEDPYIGFEENIERSNLTVDGSICEDERYGTVSVIVSKNLSTEQLCVVYRDKSFKLSNVLVVDMIPHRSEVTLIKKQLEVCIAEALGKQIVYGHEEWMK